ncbi:hypothetical protein L1887_05114 [Cichorium endivia]|nr:hypothetical protein L1887_05114 [Cichorium endivia]
MAQIDCRIIFYKPQLHVFTSSVSSTHGFDSNASRIIEKRMALAVIGMYLLATSIIVVIIGPGPDLLFNSTMGLVHSSLLVESVNGAEEQKKELMRYKKPIRFERNHSQSEKKALPFSEL